MDLDEAYFLIEKWKKANVDKVPIVQKFVKILDILDAPDDSKGLKLKMLEFLSKKLPGFQQIFDMGIVYRGIGDLRKALGYFEWADDFASPEQHFNCLWAQSNVFEEMGDLYEALARLRHAHVVGENWGISQEKAELLEERKKDLDSKILQSRISGR